MPRYFCPNGCGASKEEHICYADKDTTPQERAMRLRIQQLEASYVPASILKLTIANLLEVIADNEHKYPATACGFPNCQLCTYIASGYDLLRSL